MKFKPNERSGGVAIELRPEEGQIPMQLADEKPAALPIFSLKKILVPVDFSDCANKALTYAAALALGTDLINMPSRGEGRAPRELGSTAEKVVRQAPCPVRVVREKEHEFIKPPVIHEN